MNEVVHLPGYILSYCANDINKLILSVFCSSKVFFSPKSISFDKVLPSL